MLRRNPPQARSRCFPLNLSHLACYVDFESRTCVSSITQVLNVFCSTAVLSDVSLETSISIFAPLPDVSLLAGLEATTPLVGIAYAPAAGAVEYPLIADGVPIAC